MDSLLKLCRTLLPSEFGRVLTTQPPSARKYAIELVRRGNNAKMERDVIIKAVAALVPAEFSVDIKHADVTILIEIAGRIAGVSVLTRFAQCHKFNVRTLFEVVTGSKQESEEKPSAPGEGKRKREAAAAAAAAAAAQQDAAGGAQEEGKQDATPEVDAAAGSDESAAKRQRTAQP